MYAELKFFVVTMLLHQAFSFQQAEYRIIHEKVIIDDYNPDYIEDPSVTLFKFNETSVAFNSTTTIKRPLSNEIWAHLKILQSQDGTTYRAYPGKFSLNICEAQKKDTFGTRDIFQYGNITDCPFKPGTYYVSNYKPDESKFPAFVPHGRLVVKGKWFDGETYLGSGRWYGIVEPLQNDK